MIIDIGVARGRAALNAMLAVRAQRLTFCNIDNGFRAANAAMHGVHCRPQEDLLSWETSRSLHASS